VAVGTLALGACGSAGHTSTPAGSIHTQPAAERLARGWPRIIADPCPGISDAAGEHGVPSSSYTFTGFSDAAGARR
jgi:hypothetical protein